MSEQLTYSKPFLEWCSIMDIKPTQQFSIAFNAGYGFSAIYSESKLATAIDQRDKLLVYMQIIAGYRPCPDNLMGNADLAREAIKEVEGL